MTAKTQPFPHGWGDTTLSPDKTFDALFAAHWERVYRLLVRVVRDPAEAEALALEVFLRLWRTPPTVTDDAQLAGWLYRVAVNMGYNALRAQRRRDQYEATAGVLEPAVPPAPDEEAERRIEQATVQAVLKQLKPRSAHLLMLRYSGLSYKEIADALEIAPTSVGTLLARAEREFADGYAQATGGVE